MHSPPAFVFHTCTSFTASLIYPLF